MNNLREIYDRIRLFAEGHHMVNQFNFLSSEDEFQHMEFDYRSLIVIPSKSNISRDLSSPVYTLSFSVLILDKAMARNELATIQSIEENIFVVGQLQDYMLQFGIEVDFEDVEITSASASDYNITSVICDFDVVLGRKPYINGIDN